MFTRPAPMGRECCHSICKSAFACARAYTHARTCTHKDANNPQQRSAVKSPTRGSHQQEAVRRRLCISEIQVGAVTEEIVGPRDRLLWLHRGGMAGHTRRYSCRGAFGNPSSAWSAVACRTVAAASHPACAAGQRSWLVNGGATLSQAHRGRKMRA